MITAPFNFVPLNEKVFYPSWAEYVSHDVPFEDGESGVIDITLTAKSPIFIRNHYIKGDDYTIDKKENKISKEFCHLKLPDGSKQFYIPGSSLKGMIRNVLEIMSFSEIKVDEKLLKKPLSIRDMSQDKKTGDIFNHPMVATATKCGFLVQKDGDYFIEDCGKVLTIKENEIKKVFAEYSKDIETAEEKYNTIGHQLLPYDTYEKEDNGRKTTVAIYDKNSKNKASLIMTGAIDNKKNEFLFDTKERNLQLTENIFQNFENVYFKNTESIDGQYWKNEWNQGKKVPIFYTEENRTISAIGLTQIFKLAYNKTLFEAITQDRDENQLDLAQTIFGTEKDKIALKGRVQFSHLKSSHVYFESEKNEILGSPQPTYYPSYIRQTNTSGDKVNKFITLMDSSSTIAGFKRYPLHSNIKKSFISDDEKTDIQTNFKPLSKESKFHGKVRFHNLKKVEIGALLSALSFHGNDNFLHNIGMAKSLGYGKIDLNLNCNDLKYSKEEYLKEFETQISVFQDNWINSPQIIELFSMANNTIVNDKNLVYQKLENPEIRGREKNEFTNSKKNRNYLQNYSVITNNNFTLKPFTTQDEITNQVKKKQHDKEWDTAKNSTNIATLESFKSKYPKSEKLADADILISKIKKDIENKKIEDIKNDIKTAFENLDKSKPKFVESFIAKWKTNEYAKEYITQLENKDTSIIEKKEIGIEHLKTAQDGKQFKSILENIEDRLNHQETIKEFTIDLYQSFTGKKGGKLKKDFFKQAQLGTLISKDFENEVKSML
jgi:CRISPR-associated protein (TIGR03986 family)